MSLPSSTLLDPSILTQEQMEQLHLGDGFGGSGDDGSAPDVDSSNEQQPSTSAAGPGATSARDEERKRRNRDAARRLREKGIKKQTDVKQVNILDFGCSVA